MQHITSAGAQIEELGTQGGLLAVIARSSEEFMVLYVAPDKQAAVAGLMANISLDLLRRIAGAGFTELGTKHGLQAAVVRSGAQFQVFYATPDGTAVIPGIMWEASGRNLTRDHIASIPGAMPTVTIGDAAPALPAPRPVATSVSSQDRLTDQPHLLELNSVYAGTVGAGDAPELSVFVDPRCGYSEQAMVRLQPLVASGRVRLSVIPVAILDSRNDGASKRATLAMLSKPASEMVAAWRSGDLSGAPSDEATSRLQANMAAAAGIGLRGTPTFIWRRTDGGQGRQDGLPNDVGALVATVAGH